jgi:hypothetical protein
MMRNTKGLSTIVATLIIILLVLVAVGIIWVVVRNVIEGGASQIQGLSVDVQPTKVICMVDAGQEGNNGTCDVTYERRAGGDEIGGIKLVLKDSAGDTNYIHDVSGNINPLATQTEVNVNTGIVNVSHVEAVVYFLDESGNEVLCTASGKLDF